MSAYFIILVQKYLSVRVFSFFNSQQPLCDKILIVFSHSLHWLEFSSLSGIFFLIFESWSLKHFTVLGNRFYYIEHKRSEAAINLQNAVKD